MIICHLSILVDVKNPLMSDSYICLAEKPVLMDSSTSTLALAKCTSICAVKVELQEIPKRVV